MAPPTLPCHAFPCFLYSLADVGGREGGHWTIEGGVRHFQPEPRCVHQGTEMWDTPRRVGCSLQVGCSGSPPPQSEPATAMLQRILLLWSLQLGLKPAGGPLSFSPVHGDLLPLYIRLFLLPATIHLSRTVPLGDPSEAGVRGSRVAKFVFIKESNMLDSGDANQT